MLVYKQPDPCHAARYDGPAGQGGAGGGRDARRRAGDRGRAGRRLNVFYDLAKIAPIRLARSWAHELRGHGGTAVAVTPGWLRSEIMLEQFGVTADTWRDACVTEPHFAISESPRFVGRGIAALAADPDRHRWNGRSTSSGELGRVYGVDDVDGSRPDAWRYVTEVQDAGLPADTTGYR